MRRTARFNDLDLAPMLRNYPLLTHQEELLLGRRVQRMMALLGHRGDGAIRGWAARCELTPVQLRQALRSGKRAQDRMILGNLRLVLSIVRLYVDRCGDMEAADLFSEGVLGLRRAVEKFDPNRGYKFSTYATTWIRQRITRAIQNKSRAIRIPIHVYQAKAKVVNQMDAAAASGQRLSAREALSLVRSRPLSFDTMQDAERCWSIASLNTTVDGTGGDVELLDIVPAPSAEDLDDLTDAQRTMREAFLALEPGHQALIRRFHGIEEPKAASLREIATELGSPYAEVGRQFRLATATLRAHFHSLERSP